MGFTLDPTLAADTIKLDESDQCLLLLMNNSQYPWLIIVPKFHDAVELHDLPESFQTAIIQFSIGLGNTLKQCLSAHKINTASLGNVVSQLHIHVIARFKDDVAWPKPVWGAGQATPYNEAELKVLIDRLSWPQLP